MHSAVFSSHSPLFLIFIESILLGGYQKAKRESWAKLEHLFFAILRHAKFFPCANNCNQLASLLSRAKFIIICIVSENFFCIFRWFSLTSRRRPPLLMIYHHQNSYKSNEKITMKKFDQFANGSYSSNYYLTFFKMAQMECWNISK